MSPKGPVVVHKGNSGTRPHPTCPEGGEMEIFGEQH